MQGIPLEYLEGIDSCYFHLLMDWLGARKGTFHDMNIGAAPRVAVLRWNNYGKPATAVQELENLFTESRYVFLFLFVPPACLLSGLCQSAFYCAV